MIAKSRYTLLIKDFLGVSFTFILKQSYKVSLCGLYFAGLKSGINKIMEMQVTNE